MRLVASRRRWLVRSCALLALCAASGAGAASGTGYCGDEGVWLQILGSGGGDLNDQRSAASYLVWVDETARLLVDAGAGTALRFDEAGATMRDLHAIVFTRLRVNTTAGLASLVEGSAGERDELLPVFGPARPNGESTTAFVERMIGEAGLYPYLAGYLTFRSPGGYKLSVRDVPAVGVRRWSQFRKEDFALSAMPVEHGDEPALAWRLEVRGFVLVFAGGFSNRKNVVAKFAEDADALIVHHALPEGARGEPLLRHAVPSKLGQVAAQANARMLILGHRTVRTQGLESISRAAVEAHYQGPVIFASELECWGL